MICQNCKKEQTNEEARFCYFCGRRLIRQDKQPPAVIPPAPQRPPAPDGANTVVYSRRDIEAALENRDAAARDILTDIDASRDAKPEENIDEEKIVYGRAAFEEKAEAAEAPEAPADEEAVENEEKKQKIAPRQQDDMDQTLFLYGSKKEKSDRLKDLFENEDGSVGPGRDFFLDEADMSMAEMKKKKAEELSRKRGRKKALKMLSMVLAFFACFSVMTLVFLYNMNSPKKTVAAFGKAVSAGDYSYLSKSAVFRGVELNSKNASVLFDYLKGAPDIERLEKELLEKGISEAYPAISLKSQPLFFFIKRYQVEVEACSLFVSGLAEEGELLVDSLPAKGRAENGGFLIEGLMPGSHSYTASGPAAEDGSRSEILSGNILVSQPAKAAHLDIPPPEPPEPVIVTVSGCVSDNADIYINGALVEDKPVNGVLSLTNPPAGCEIKIVVQMENYTREAVVTYNGGEETQLSFNDYIGEPPPPPPPPEDPGAPDPAADPEGFANYYTTAEINTLISDFYTSYLECINAQSMDYMRHSTDFMNRNLVPRIGMSGNVNNHFVFKGANCVSESFHGTSENGMPAVLINAQFDYEYRSRDSNGEYVAGSSKSSLQLLYVDGQWVVNRMVAVSDEQYAANQFGDYSTAIP